MSTDRIGTRRILFDAVLSAFGLASYAAISAWVLASSTAKVYGFPISRDLRSLIEIAFEICPMLAAFLLVLLLPVRERLVNRMAQRMPRVLAILATGAAFAVASVLATAAAIVYVGGRHAGAIAAVTVFRVGGELAFDLCLIAVFTSLLYALKRTLWVTLPLFIAYIIAVAIAGPSWGITSYIGFGSSVPLLLTTYSNGPLYDRAAWLLRVYWSTVTLVLLAILAAFDRPNRSIAAAIQERFRAERLAWRPLASIAGLSLLFVFTASQLVRLQRHALARYQTPANAAAACSDDCTHRLQLKAYDVKLNYAPKQEMVAVEGVLTFQNGDQPIRVAYFQVPELVTPESLSITGAGPARVTALGKYLQVSFPDPLAAAQEVRVEYRGAVHAAGPFDLATQGKLLGNAFFLADTDIMPSARRGGCLESSQPQSKRTTLPECANEENYLMSDRATGRISVVAPEGLRVVATGEQIDERRGDGVEHVFTIRSPQLASFLVACAPFREAVAASTSGGADVHVYRAPAAPDSNQEAPLAQHILAYYESVWPAYGRPALNIVEAPTPLGEALAFDGTVAISDKIIGSRSPGSDSASNLLSFVMAHEIAHEWWGFRVVPAHSPGRFFVIESLPQFAAYQYLNASGIVKPEMALRNEERRYKAAQSRLGSRDVPLAQASTADEVAYNKGPYVLLTLDHLGHGSLMEGLGRVIGRYSDAASHGLTPPDHVMNDLVAELPASAHDRATELLFGAGRSGEPQTATNRKSDDGTQR